MCMLDTIRAKREEIYAIARKHKAEKLWVFGSCARRDETPESDVDFLVRYTSGVTYMVQSAFHNWHNQFQSSTAMERKIE